MKLKYSKTICASAAAIAVAFAATAISSYRVKRLGKEAEIRQAEKAKAILEARAAEDRRLAKEKELAAAEAKRSSLAAEEALKEREAEAERERQRTLASEQQLKDVSAREAADRRAAAEAEKKAAEAKLLAAEAAERAAGENRLAKEAELKSAEIAKATAAAKEAEAAALLKAEELKAVGYAELVAEAKEIRDELRRREEETRPDRTLRDLVADNNADRSRELGISEEENRARLKSKDPEQPLIKAAGREGRVETAEALLANLVSLVPEYAGKTNPPSAAQESR